MERHWHRLFGIVSIWEACILGCSGGSAHAKAPSSDAAVPHAALPTNNPASGGAGGVRATPVGGPARDAQIACTKDASPDEFAVPCSDRDPVDASSMDAGERHAPMPDAGDPVHDKPDAARPLDAGDDASTLPPPPDEGQCAVRGDSCQFGHAATSVGSATCTIALDSLLIQRQICEVCGKSTDLVEFSLTVMDCGGCAQVYSDGYANQSMKLASNACISRSDPASLAWTAADPHCVDVYADVSSGIASMNGWTTQSRDQVRVCRCDRTTDTCIPCVNGACDKAP